MFNFIYKLYFNSKKSTLFGKVDFWGRLYALLIRNLLPKYYKLTANLAFANKPDNNRIQVIVSLTSYPGRINIVWQSIESILRQSYKPSKVILWLATDQIPNTDHLPTSLKKLMKRGLLIEFRDDIRPHKKYYYAMKEYPDSIIITIDDDVIYPSDMIKNFVDFHQLYPHSILCNGARLIKSDKNGFAKYKEWENWHAIKIESIPRYDLLPLGVMGVFYPPKSLNEFVFDVDSIRRLCLNADDLWLKAMALKQKTTCVLTNSYPRPFVEILSSQTSSLMATNVRQSQNDQQIAAINNELNIYDDYLKLIIGD